MAREMIDLSSQLLQSEHNKRRPGTSPTEPTRPPVDVEQAVRQRHEAAAEEAEPALCCPVDDKPECLAAIPEEIIRRDYGCGDLSKHVAPGEQVLDLGSGGGKIWLWIWRRLRTTWHKIQSLAATIGSKPKPMLRSSVKHAPWSLMTQSTWWSPTAY